MAVADYFKNVDKDVYYFKFSPFNPNGSDWHPNMEEHRKMASELIPFVKEITGW